MSPLAVSKRNKIFGPVNSLSICSKDSLEVSGYQKYISGKNAALNTAK